MTSNLPVSAGRAYPLGATFDGEGVNFAVFSEHATRMWVCLFSEDGKTEVNRIALPERDGDVWHGYVSGLRPSQQYGLRADGPYKPQDGHRFNVNKLLIDPYATRLSGQPIWDDAVLGYVRGHDDKDLSFDTRDSAPFMPRSLITDTSYSWGDDCPPETPIDQSIIYEAHPKGLTQLHPTALQKGTFLGLSSEPVLEHLNNLGITAIELLPVHAFPDDHFLMEKGLKNYWGYQSLGFFAPDPRYMLNGQISEFQQMVARMHAAGIEVILDVVYNHTCEGSEMGPTLAFRGLDNHSYYRLADDKRFYINDTGTGNTVNLSHPMVLRMVMDSLRYWVEVMHVDGFRFDLCSTLGRTDVGFDRGAAFFDAIRQDPVLTRVKLIAEPWDIGPGGYQVGAFPPPFLEWNDKYRDGVRRFWRKDPGSAADLAERLLGSSTQFDHSGRPATSSVNLLTAHDGFTLADVVSFNDKHNDANGEDGRDGHGENYSDNMGVEGPTNDPVILEARLKRRRAMMATLLFSQGTPMILAGDELGNSQNGNNNAYCQDNEIGWIDWENADPEFVAFTSALIKFRKNHPILRQKLFLHSRERITDGIEDLFWWKTDGTPMEPDDWSAPEHTCVVAEMRTASGTPRYASLETAILGIFNSGDGVDVTLPKEPDGMVWVGHVDTDSANFERRPLPQNSVLKVAACSVQMLVLETVV